MKTKLWLDDRRPAPDDHHHVKTASLALASLRLGNFKEASLDHDLGHDTMTGLWFLRAAHQHGVELPPVVHLHTQNPAGRLSMGQHLEDIGYLRDHTRFATWYRLDDGERPS